VPGTAPGGWASRVVQEPGVVGADVEEDRQGARRVDAAQRRVQRQLADRDAHAADALVTQAQNPLPVGDDDDVDLPPGPVTQDLPDAVAVGVGDEEAARTAVDLAEALAGQPDRRGVKDRQHLLDVVGHQPVEQRLVGVLQRAQVTVPGDVGGLLLVGPVPAPDLLLQRLHDSRQQATQTLLGAFLLGERGALVRQRILQHPHPGTLIDAHDLFPFRPDARRAATMPLCGGQAVPCPLSVEQPEAFPSSMSSSSLEETIPEPGMPRSAAHSCNRGSARQRNIRQDQRCCGVTSVARSVVLAELGGEAVSRAEHSSWGIRERT
jgi:hypothetical protein